MGVGFSNNGFWKKSSRLLAMVLIAQQRDFFGDMSLHERPLFHVLILIKRKPAYDAPKPAALSHFSLDRKGNISAIARRLICH